MGDTRSVNQPKPSGLVSAHPGTGTVASTATALSRLAALVPELLWISEADHPWLVVRLGTGAELDLPRALTAAASRVGCEVQRLAIENFFERATQAQPYHTVADRITVERYQALVRFLTGELADARVYRVGAIGVDVYAIGRSREGEWVGVATKVIET